MLPVIILVRVVCKIVFFSFQKGAIWLAYYQYFCNMGHSTTYKPKYASLPQIETCFVISPPQTQKPKTQNCNMEASLVSPSPVSILVSPSIGKNGLSKIIWSIWGQHTSYMETRGVSHRGLAIYIKKYLKAKEELWKFKNIKSWKRNQNPLRYHNSITNLMFQHKPKYHLSKILI